MGQCFAGQLKPSATMSGRVKGYRPRGGVREGANEPLLEDGRVARQQLLFEHLQLGSVTHHNRG